MLKLLIINICLLVSFNVLADELKSNQEKIIVSGHPDYPPIMWKKGEQVIGVASHIIKEFFSDLDIEVEREFIGPWKRVQESARHGWVDAVAACYINTDRETHMDFSDPILTDSTSIFVRKGTDFKYENWDDLIGKRGMTLFGDSYGEEFDNFIEEKLRVRREYNVKDALDALVAGQVDYFFFGYYPTIVSARLAGYGDDIIALDKPIVEENMYLAFSKKSKYKKYIPQLNKKISEYKDKGLIKKWTEQYLKLHISEKIDS